MDMFEKATRLKLRFSTGAGRIGVEDLWDMTLEQLDKLAVDLHGALGSTSLSFVTPVQAKNTELQLKFNIVKHIIDTKVAERDDAATAKERAEEKQKLLEIIQRKEDQALENLSTAELKKRVKQLAS